MLMRSVVCAPEGRAPASESTRQPNAARWQATPGMVFSLHGCRACRLRAERASILPRARGQAWLDVGLCGIMVSIFSRASMLNPALLTALGNILPAAAILTAAEDTRPYECDGLTMFRVQAGAVVLPETEAQVVAILKLCNAARLPVVARGAGTGLSGGALPLSDGLVLSLAKFQRILSIDPLERTATVQPGVRNLAVSQAVAPLGLYYAPDPSSQIACTIGGNVAENSGGVHCLKYGLTVHNVRRVRAVLMNGEVVEFGGAALDASGYDLLAVICGSEGLLAVITEITVKLTPKPLLAQVALAAFDDI